MNIVFDGFSVDNTDIFLEILSPFIKDTFTALNQPVKIYNKGDASYYIHITNRFIGNTEYLIGNIIFDKKMNTTAIMKNDTFSSLTTNSGESVIDFNYFVINKTTWKGIFSSYRGAFSIHSFNYFINYLRKNKILELYNNIDKQNLKNKDKKQKKKTVKKIYGKTICITLLKSSESFLDKMDQLAVLNSITYAIDLSKETSAFSSLATKTKSERIQLVMDNKKYKKIDILREAHQAISNFLKQLKNDNEQINHLTATGKDLKGNEWTINYHKPFEKLDKFPYDKAVQMLDKKHLYDLDNEFVDTIMDLMNQL